MCRKISPLAALSSALLLLGACGGQDHGSEWTGTVADSAGITVVSNPGEGIWTDEDRWTLTKELRIGVASGDPELEFGLIAGLDADDEGHIFVLDQQASRIRVFDEDGRLIHAFGRAGQGPDELSQAATGLFVDVDGNLLVPDLMNQRLARFSPDGSALTASTLDLAQGVPMLWVADANRNIYQQVRRMSLPGMPEVGGDPVDMILSRDAGGEITDTVAVLPAGETFQTRGGAVTALRLFAPEPLWTVLEDGRIVSGTNSEYSLSLRGPSGEVETIIRREFTRREVTASDRDGFRNALLDVWEDAGMPAATASEMANILQFEEHWPALAALLGGPDGSLWVQRVDPDDALDVADLADMQSMDLGSPRWDIFDVDGRYLGVLEMPEGFAPRRVMEDRIYGIHRDELGVQRVVRLRLERGQE